MAVFHRRFPAPWLDISDPLASVSTLAAYFHQHSHAHGGVFLRPTRNLATQSQPAPRQPLESSSKNALLCRMGARVPRQIEDAKLPLENEDAGKIASMNQTIRKAIGARPRPNFAKGRSVTAQLRERHLSRPAQPAPVQPFDATGTATRLEANDSRWHERAIAEVPLFSPVHGDLRALRRLRRQVSLLYRLRRSQEHAVLRAELMRSVYRRYFTLTGRLLARLWAARD